MKNWCPKCHKQNAQTANFCLFCGMKLSADADVEVGKIDFLLAELTDWQRRGLVWGAAFETLRAEYVSRRSELLGESQETEEPVKPQPVQQPLSIDMAQKLLKDGEYTEALKVCSELLDKYPRSAALFSLRANAHERSGNLEQAAEDAMRAWALDKNNQFYTGQARRLQRAAAGDSPDSETPPTPAPAKVEFTKPARAVSPPSPPTVEMESRASHATGAPLPSKPEIDWIGWLNAFLEERNIQRGWVIVGLLLVGGFIGLVKQTWGAVGEYVLYLGLVGATAGSYFGGRKLTRLGEGWKVSGFCLMTMGMLLLPLDVIALRQRLALSPAALGLLTSAVCLIAYTTATWRMRVEWFAYITGAACLSTLYYLLQILKVSPSCYGLFTMPLAFAALYLGWRCRESEHRLFSQPLVRMAHGVVALTYVIMMAHWRFFLTQGIFQSVGVVAMGTALYTASGYLFDEYASVYLSAGLAVAFSLLLTQGLAPDLAWQHARLIVLLVTFGLLVGGLVSEQSLKREKLSEGYRWSGVVLAGLLVATIAGEGFAVKLVPQPSPELISTIVVSLLSAALYAWMTYLFQRPAMTYVTGGLFAYTIFLVMVQARVACAWWSLGLAAVAWAYCGVAHWIEDVTSPVSGTPTTGAQIDPDRHAPRGALSRIAGCDSPLYDTAHIVAAVAALIALGLGFSHDERASVATGTTLTLVALTALYVYTAWRASNPSWLHAGILCFGLGVRFASLLVDWDLVLRLGLPHFFLEENFGWQVSGLAAALVLLGWRLQQQKMEGFAKPVLQWAIGLGGVGLLSLPFHYFGGEGLRSTAAALYVYAAIALGASVLFRHVEVQGTEVSLPSLLTYLGAALIPMGQFCVCDLLNLGYPLSALIAAILSLVYLLAADALFRFEDKGVWSQPLFALAHSLSFVAVVLGVGHYYAATGLDIKNQVAAGEALMTMSTSAVALLLAIGGVVLQRKPYFACLGSAYGLALYATLLHRLPSLVNASERNYGLLFLPFVCLLLITAVLCRRKREIAIFPAAGAAAVAVVSVVSQFWYEQSGLHASVLATLLAYAALTISVSLALRQPLVLCGVTFLCAWATTHVGLWLRHAEPLLGLEQVVLAWVYLAVAVYLTKRTPPHAEWSKPLDLSALVLSGLGATISAAGGSNNTLWACGVASALTTGLFCLQAWRSDEPVIGYVPAFLVALFYAAGRDVYSENLWALAPALSATGIYFALGYVTHKQRFVFLSLIGLWWAWLMTAGLWLGGELASGIGTQRHLTLVAIVASVAAFGYACVAERWKSTALAYATAVTFILASVAALVAFGVEDSVTLCTLAGVLLTLLLTIEGHRFETLRAPFRHVATLISPGVMLCAYQGTHELFAGVVCGYAVLYFVAAWILRSTSYAYASPATASILLVIHGALHGLSGPQSALYFALLGLLWVIVGSVLEEMGAWDVLFHSLYQFACGTAALTAIGGFAIALDDVGHGAFAVYALIVDAVVFSALWYRWREEALLHVGYFCVVLAYFLPLIQHQVRVPDAYALPIGLYLIVVGYTGYRKGRLADPNGLYNAGLLISLSSTFLAAMPATAIAHHLVLMTLTVAAVAVGISQRLKTFLVQGTGFLSAFIFYRVSGLLPDVRLNWAFYAIGLAVTLAIALLTFNAKREQVLRSMRWVQKEWTIFR